MGRFMNKNLLSTIFLSLLLISSGVRAGFDSIAIVCGEQSSSNNSAVSVVAQKPIVISADFAKRYLPATFESAELLGDSGADGQVTVICPDVSSKVAEKLVELAKIVGGCLSLRQAQRNEEGMKKPPFERAGYLSFFRDYDIGDVDLLKLLYAAQCYGVGGVDTDEALMLSTGIAYRAYHELKKRHGREWAKKIKELDLLKIEMKKQELLDCAAHGGLRSLRSVLKTTDMSAKEKEESSSKEPAFSLFDLIGSVFPDLFFTHKHSRLGKVHACDLNSLRLKRLRGFDSFNGAKNLIYVNLSNNQLDSSDLEDVCKLPSLKELDVSKNLIKNPEACDEAKNLEVLDLSKNPLNHEIKKHPALVRLAVDDEALDLVDSSFSRLNSKETLLKIPEWITAEEFEERMRSLNEKDKLQFVVTPNTLESLALLKADEVSAFKKAAAGNLTYNDLVLHNTRVVDRKGYTLLHVVSAKGTSVESIERVIDCGADIEAKNEDGWTPLHHASCKGDRAVIAKLREKGADLKAKTNNDLTPLELAAYYGRADAVEELLKGKGIELIEVEDKNGSRALHWASRKGHPGVITKLREKGADLEAKTNNGLTPLHAAAFHGRADAVEELLKGNGIKLIEAKDNLDRTPLHLASYATGNRDVIAKLREKGADLKAKTNDGQIPLHNAACYSGADAVEELLKGKGIELVEAKDDLGWTSLHWASKAGDRAVIAVLREKGADLKAKTNSGQTPLHIAVFSGRADAVEELLKGKGIELIDSKNNSKNNGSATPLHIASWKGHREVIAKLREKGADLTVMRDGGRIALHDAARYGHAGSVEELLKGRGVELIDIKDNKGAMPLDLALSKGHHEIVKLLDPENAEELIRSYMEKQKNSSLQDNSTSNNAGSKREREDTCSNNNGADEADEKRVKQTEVLAVQPVSSKRLFDDCDSDDDDGKKRQKPDSISNNNE